MLIFNEAYAGFDAKRKVIGDAAYLSNSVITWGRSDKVKWRIFIPYGFATDNLNTNSGTARALAKIQREMSRVSNGMQYPT
jgi:hypothetical protein